MIELSNHMIYTMKALHKLRQHLYDSIYRGDSFSEDRANIITDCSMEAALRSWPALWHIAYI